MNYVSTGGGGASSSVAVAVSDSTPNFGDSVTITATPTGITPTNYTYIVPKDDGSYMRVTQASNVYVWTAVYMGEQTIEVIATDGVLFASNTASVTVTWSFGKALSYNGTTQTTKTTSAVSGKAIAGVTFCLSYWVKFNSYTNTPILFSDAGGGGFYMWHTSAAQVIITNRVYAITAPTGEWHHFLINKTGGANTNWELYHNGVSIAASAGTSGYISSFSTLYLASYSEVTYGLNGFLDESLCIANYNAAASQVLEYYNSGNGAHPSVLGRMPTWRISFDDNVNDVTGNKVGCANVNSPTYVTH
jgi:hypothetical protein